MGQRIIPINGKNAEKVAVRSCSISRKQTGTVEKFRAGLHFDLNIWTTDLPCSLFLVCYIGFLPFSMCVQRIFCHCFLSVLIECQLLLLLKTKGQLKGKKPYTFGAKFPKFVFTVHRNNTLHLYSDCY